MTDNVEPEIPVLVGYKESKKIPVLDQTRLIARGLAYHFQRTEAAMFLLYGHYRALLATRVTFKSWFQLCYLTIACEYYSWKLRAIRKECLAPDQLYVLALWLVESSSVMGSRLRIAYDLSSMLIDFLGHRESYAPSWKKSYAYLLHAYCAMKLGHSAHLMEVDLRNALKEAKRWDSEVFLRRHMAMRLYARVSCAVSSHYFRLEKKEVLPESRTILHKEGVRILEESLEVLTSEGYEDGVKRVRIALNKAVLPE